MQYFTKLLIIALLFSIFPHVYPNADVELSIKLSTEYSRKFLKLPKDHKGIFKFMLSRHKASWDMFEQYTGSTFPDFLDELVLKFNANFAPTISEKEKQEIINNNPLILSIEPIIGEITTSTHFKDNKSVISIQTKFDLKPHCINVSIYQNILLNGELVSLPYAHKSAIEFMDLSQTKQYLEKLVFDMYEELKARSQIN